MRIWTKAGIKTQLHGNCIRKLKNLRLQWMDIKKHKTRNDEERRENLQETSTAYGTAPQGLLFIRSSQAVFLVRKKEKKENVEFYLDQRTRRKGMISSMDKTFSKRVEEKERRELRADRMQTSATGVSSDLETDG